MPDSENRQERRGQSLGKVFKSVAASMFGVQSSKSHEEDFKHGKASTYIIIGILATILFVLTVWGVVQLVMHTAAP